MAVSVETDLSEMLDAHPYLLDFLVGYDSVFRKLREPLVMESLAGRATVSMLADMAGVRAERLSGDLEAEIGRHVGNGIRR